MENRFEKNKLLGRIALGLIALAIIEALAFGVIKGQSYIQKYKSYKSTIEFLKQQGVEEPGVFLDEVVELFYSKGGPRFHPYRWFYLKPSHVGKYHSTDKYGFRNKIDAENSEKAVIAFYGGSTMYSTVTMEKDSLPRLIAPYLDANKIRPVNFGMGWYDSSAEMMTFIETTRVNKNIKYAVFLDGVNDVARYIERLQSGNDEPIYDIWGFPLKTQGLCLGLSHTYKAGWGMCDDGGSFPYSWSMLQKYAGITKKENDKINYDEAAGTIASIYINNMETVRHLAVQAGVKPIFLLQPQIFSKKKRTPAEENIRMAMLNKEVDVERLYKESYSKIISLANERKLPFYDVSGAFDDLDENGIHFNDFCHVDAVGNKALAKAIADVLRHEVE
ncbi:MAG: hypothetical protein HQK86_09110 [Nitrospinae bacterium]|nr:hypothetical protein [Nitrospinota bacterium]